MRRALQLAILTGAVFTAPALASAEDSPLFAAFRHICIDTAGDIDAMRKAADANFEPPSRVFDDADGSTASIQYYDANTGRMLSVRRMRRPAKSEIPAVDEVTCAYMQTGPAQGLVDEAARWAGTPAREPLAFEDADLSDEEPSMDTEATFFTFVVTAQGEHRDMVGRSDADYAEAFRAGAVYWLGVMTGGVNGFQLTYEKALPTP